MMKSALVLALALGGMAFTAAPAMAQDLDPCVAWQRCVATCPMVDGVPDGFCQYSCSMEFDPWLVCALPAAPPHRDVTRQLAALAHKTRARHVTPIPVGALDVKAKPVVAAIQPGA